MSKNRYHLMSDIKISLSKMLKGWTREVQHQQLISRVFLEATRSNNGIRLSKDRETTWNLFDLCAVWRNLHHRSKLQNRHMYLAYEQECSLLTRDVVTEVRLSILRASIVSIAKGCSPYDVVFFLSPSSLK